MILENYNKCISKETPIDWSQIKIINKPIINSYGTVVRDFESEAKTR